MSELLNCDWGYFQVTRFVITEALPRCETLTILFFGKNLVKEQFTIKHFLYG